MIKKTLFGILFLGMMQSVVASAKDIAAAMKASLQSEALREQERLAEALELSKKDAVPVVAEVDTCASDYAIALALQDEGYGSLSKEGGKKPKGKGKEAAKPTFVRDVGKLLPLPFDIKGFETEVPYPQARLIQATVVPQKGALCGAHAVRNCVKLSHIALGTASAFKKYGALLDAATEDEKYTMSETSLLLTFWTRHAKLYTDSGDFKYLPIAFLDNKRKALLPGMDGNDYSLDGLIERLLLHDTDGISVHPVVMFTGNKEKDKSAHWYSLVVVQIVTGGVKQRIYLVADSAGNANKCNETDCVHKIIKHVEKFLS